MDPEQAYEWLAPKLSTEERKALDVIYHAWADGNEQISQAFVSLALEGIRPESLHEGLETLRRQKRT